jgi:hypothetical protein
MEELLKFLKHENVWISFGDRWLIVGTSGIIRVYERKYRARNITLVYEGSFWDLAISELRKG